MSKNINLKCLPLLIKLKLNNINVLWIICNNEVIGQLS